MRPGLIVGRSVAASTYLILYLGGAARPLSAQTAGRLDLGVSTVRFDGFLAAAAWHISPTLQHDSRNLSLAGQGTLNVFETGNTIVQGQFAGAWLTSNLSRVRGEIYASLGLSSYDADVFGTTSYGHALFRGRLHYTERRTGVWVGAATGRTFLESTGATPYRLSAGIWQLLRGVSLEGMINRTWLADTSYVDVLGTVRWNSPRLEVEGIGGFRTLSDNGGEGAFGELVARIRILDRIAAVVSGGRYASDPVRGYVAARYLSVGLELTAFRGEPPPSARYAELLRNARRLGPPEQRARVVGLNSSIGGVSTLRIRIPRASRVELMGDFTDWEPVLLRRTSSQIWEVTLVIPPGFHRFNVRIDGQPWTTPAGVPRVRDDFGTEVGLLVVEEQLR